MMDCRTITAKCKSCWPRPCLEAPEEDYEPGALAWMNTQDQINRISRVCSECGKTFFVPVGSTSKVCHQCRSIIAQRVYREKWKQKRTHYRFIPAALEAAMAKKGVSGYQVERAVHIANGTVSAWKRGKEGTTMKDKVEAVCEFLGVPEEKLVVVVQQV